MRLISISKTIAVPPNGLVLFVGTILTDEGKEKKVSFDFEPHKPINTWVIVQWVGEDDEGNHLERVLSILSLLLMDYMGRGRTKEIPQFVLKCWFADVTRWSIAISFLSRSSHSDRCTCVTWVCWSLVCVMMVVILTRLSCLHAE